jgi:hypothetical protein
MTEPTETLHDAELQKAPDAAKAEAKPESKTTADENNPLGLRVCGSGCIGE